MRSAKLDFAGALKDAALAALVAFGLFSLMLGLRTETGPTGRLEVLPRPGLLAIAVAIVFAGRLLIALFARSRLGGDLARSLQATTPEFEKLGRFVAPALLTLALLAPVLFYSNRYILDLGILVLTYIMLGWGLNIVVGLAGLLDLGYVAFYAVGAYAYALLAQNFSLSFWICLPLAGILAAFWGVMLGFPVLRLRGDYLAIVTLAFGEIIRIVIINWQSFTNGPNGISGIPRPSFFGLPFNDGESGFAAFFGLEFNPVHRIIFLFYLILALALLTNFVTLRLRRLPIGRAWEALREDEIACRSLGINTTNTKLTAFRHGGDVRWLRRLLLRDAPRIHQPGVVRVHGIGAGARDRGAGRHGLAARRRGGGPRHDRRLRVFPPVRAIPHARLWHRHGRDHGLAPARADRHAHALGVFAEEENHPRRHHRRGATMNAPAGDIILDTQHLSMRFGGLVAVDDLSFAAKRGEITAIIGPNGAGKTTVFNCITGFYQPSEGMIRILHPDGKEFLLERLPDFRIAARARRPHFPKHSPVRRHDRA